MSRSPKDSQLEQQAKLGHETRDANLKWVLISGAGLFILIVGTLFLVNWTFAFLARGNQRTDTPRPPLAEMRVKPAGPALQPNPYGDLKEYRERENQILHGYWRHQVGNVPLETVSIPIDRAMDLVIERGLLPVTTAPAVATQPGK